MSILGSPASVLIGDFWLVKAMDSILSSEKSGNIVIRIFAKTLSDLAEGETYTLYADGSELFQTTLTGTVTTVNESGENTQAGNFGGFGGFGRR